MEVRLETARNLPSYSRISIAFTVYSIFDIVPVQNGLAGLSLSERKLDVPFVKDYDREEAGGPINWPERFDIRNWALFLAYENELPIGGTAVAWNTLGLDMLQGRKDIALIWDLRIAPEWRHRGVGRQLFVAAREWAKSKGCTEIRVETQNINIPACRFYASQGFGLFSIDPLAYPNLPNETQLLWRLPL